MRNRAHKQNTSTKSRLDINVFANCTVTHLLQRAVVRVDLEGALPVAERVERITTPRKCVASVDQLLSLLVFHC